MRKATYKITEIQAEEIQDCIPSSIEVSIPETIAWQDRNGDGEPIDVREALLGKVNAVLDLDVVCFTAERIR